MIKKNVDKCTSAPAKWVLISGDRLHPASGRNLSREQILEQLGESGNSILVRDLDGPNDQLIQPGEVVELAEGNVFRVLPTGSCIPDPPCDATPKLSWVVDDQFELSLNPKQTKESLRRLFSLDSQVDLLRDLESPTDQTLEDDEPILFEQGPVFTQLSQLVTVEVNNCPVTLKPGKTTGQQIKRAAINQGVTIDLGCVLFALQPDGSLSEPIKDDECIVIKACLEFRCIAPDDVS